jgi:hypothetical protein
MPVGKIGITQRNKSGQGNKGVNGFESQCSDTLYYKCADRDAGANNV